MSRPHKINRDLKRPRKVGATDDEWSFLMAAAKSEGMTTSKYIISQSMARSRVNRKNVNYRPISLHHLARIDSILTALSDYFTLGISTVAHGDEIAHSLGEIKNSFDLVKSELGLSKVKEPC